MLRYNAAHVKSGALVGSALQSAGPRDGVRVLVGGAPVTEDWALSIGADAYGRDVPMAVAAARGLLR